MSEFQYTTALNKIRHMKSRIKVIQGGTSASKTFSILPILINMACIEKVSISIVSESHPHLRKGAIRDFINIMNMTNRYIDKHWNRTNSVYTFTNGSYIEFFSADSADKLRGSRRDILFVNECNNITQEAYEQLAMRTAKDIFLDYNPSHKFWVDDVLVSDEAEMIILTYKDNEALSPTIVNYLESKRVLALTSAYWENWCRVYLDGKQGTLEGVIFNNFKKIDKIPTEARLIGCGMDFGYTNDPTTLISVYKYNDEYILDELLFKKGMLNSEIANYIKSNSDIERSIIIADSAEPKSIAEIKAHGIRIKGVKKGKGSILSGISGMQECQYLITKNSTELLKEFERYSWDKDKTGAVTNKPIDIYNHGIDAVRYLTSEMISKRTGYKQAF